MGVFQGDLAILLSVRDEERHPDFLHLPIKRDVLTKLEECLFIWCAPNPIHVIPVVRHRALTLISAARLLHLSPVVIGTPDEAAGETGLVSDGSRRVVPA